MYVRLALVGGEPGGEPIQVNLPQYQVVEVNYVEGWATVVPGYRTVPPSLPAKGTPLYPFIGTDYVLIGLTPEQLTAWYAKLAQLFPGHEPPYTPEFP